MKKKLSEKVEKAKALFDKVGIELDDEQLHTFVTTFELQKNEAIAEAVEPVKAKLEEYQKQNYKLQGQLAGSKQFSDEFEKLIEEKAKEISAIKIPDIPNIELVIEKKLSEKLNLFEKKLSKLDEAANRINDKILPLNMAEEIKKITDLGTLFSNYKQEFAKHLVDLESAEIKKLKESTDAALKKMTEAEKKVIQLQEQLVKERQYTEITLLLENSRLDIEEKELMYKFYERSGYEEGKTEIQKFITTKENKESIKPVQRSYVRETSGGVKAINETGILRKARPLVEGTSFDRDIDEWAKIAGVNNSEKV